MAKIAKLIRNPVANTFRRADIKRRQTSDGKYESTWQSITEFIKRWGTFKATLDDVRLNRFTHSGIRLTVRNDTGAFNPETNANSKWRGFLTRYRTLVRIQAGYFDANRTEYPTDTTDMGVFIIDDEIPINGINNEAVLNCSSLVSIFDEVKATDIPGLGTPQTASELIATIRDATDGSNNFIFREFITSTAWTIQSTTTNYNLATSTSLDGLTTWEMMEKLSESEGFVMFINRTGGFEFRNRDERTTTSQFLFLGQGFPKPNVIKVNQFKEALNKHFNFFRVKFDEPDTSTSFVETGTLTAIDPVNVVWKYGSRRLEFDNQFIPNSTTAKTITDGLFSTFGTELKTEVSIEAKFVPHIEILDKVQLSHRTYKPEENTLWNQFKWVADGTTTGDTWADESGENFDFFKEPFKVISKSTNLDNFTTKFILREI